MDLDLLNDLDALDAVEAPDAAPPAPAAPAAAVPGEALRGCLARLEGVAVGELTLEELMSAWHDLEEACTRLAKEVALLYASVFPELATLVAEPLKYLASVRALLSADPWDELERLLAPALFLQVRVAATALGAALAPPAETREALLAAVDLAERAGAARKALSACFDGVAAGLAPNTTALLGPALTAMLLGEAGGVRGLAVMPACNLLSLGRQARPVNPHQPKGEGWVFGWDGMEGVPADKRKMVARWLVGKVALAARVDMASPPQPGAPGVGDHGAALRKALLEKILQQILAPAKTREPALIKAPDNPRSRRRGGKRVRRWKDKNAASELQRQSMRVRFGTEADDVLAEDIDEGRPAKRALAVPVKRAGLSRKGAKELEKMSGTSSNATSVLRDLTQAFSEGQP